MGITPESGKSKLSSIPLVVIAVFFVLFSVACSSSGNQGSAESGGSKEMTVTELVRLSERTTARAESARVDMTMTMSGQEDMPSFQFTSEGVQDFASGESAFMMSMPMFGEEIEVRAVGAMVYQRWPEEMLAQSGLPAGKTWISTDINEQYRKQTGLSLESLQSQATSSPAGQLEYLRSVGSAKKVGEESVRGTPTTHYRAVVDLDRELDSVRGEAQDAQALEEYYEQIKEQLGTNEFPMDVWLDDQGRVRRCVLNMSVPVPQPTADGTEMTAPEGTDIEKAEITIATELYDYGVPVEVTEPPAQKTVSDTELLAAQNQTALVE